MRPWILSGNWINEALDTTYDPVFSFLRDYLSAEGSIRVTPMTEVQILDFNNYFWLERLEIEKATKEWGVWHCVLGSGWESDLASQISLALSNWESNASTDAASIVTDSLVSCGTV
jgi:hypothetical protein